MTDQRVWSWRQAICNSALESTTRLVLQTLACWMNEMGGGCYPAASTLADACGLTEKSIFTHLQKAKEAGWLEINQHGFKGQKWRRNEYQATWPDDDIDPEKGHERGSVPSKKVVNEVPKGGEPDAKKVVNEVHTNSPKNLSSNNSPTGGREAEPPTEHQRRVALGVGFDEFGLKKECPDPILRQFIENVWVHDCKRSDEAPRPAFITFGLLSDQDRQAAVEGLPVYAAKLSREKADKEFRRSLKRWLAERGWLGMDATPEDAETARVLAENTHVNRQRNPKLYAACVKQRWPNDDSKQTMALGWRGAMFANDLVARAGRSLEPDVHEELAEDMAGQGP